jgi:uncharacterized membrane protein
MNFYKWLTVIGGVLLVSGLLTAFISSHYTERVTSEARNGGVVIRTPGANSPDWRKNESVLWWPDLWFYVGLVLTGIGGIVLGIILPLFLMKIRRRATEALRKSDKQRG